MARALIALGGNVGDVRATFDRAVDLLCDGNTVRLVARSSDYRTPPWGVEDQPPFVNACLVVDTVLPPRGLLDLALSVEATLGRNRARETRWGPRALDIDLIDYDGQVIDEPGLELPHPRLFERAFVLVPLVEIAPDLMIGGTTVREALARFGANGTRIGASGIGTLYGIERLPARRRV
jgi:2-amino-4-hydroxy-6-hydroxymethyldihydropteridine diphosphokinase